MNPWESLHRFDGLWALGVVGTIAMLGGCQSEVREPEPEPGGRHPVIQVLAKNVLMSEVHAEELEVDESLKVMANNVLLAEDGGSSLRAANAQEAFKEMSLKLAQVMPGQWNITNKAHESFHGAKGKLSVDEHGGMHLSDGSLAAIGLGSGDVRNGFCHHYPGSAKVEFVGDRLAIFRFQDDQGYHQLIPRIVELSNDRLLLVGSGGCGTSQQRVSILTRVKEQKD